MFNYNQRQATDWHGMLENLRQYRAKVNEYSSGAPGLAPVLQKEFEAERDRMRGQIIDGAISEFRQAMTAYFDASRRLDNAKTGEMARWNLPLVSAEKAAIVERIREIANQNEIFGGQQNKDVALRNLFAEGMAGIPERKRATLEAFERLGEMSQLTHMRNQLQHGMGEYITEARQKLAELRSTDDIQKAQESQRNSLHELLAKKKMLAETAEGIGEPINNFFPSSQPLDRAYRQVQLTPNENGSYDVMVYPEDAPEVTGVYWKAGEK